MNICKMAQEVHENARNHGWWDEDRSFGTIAALICSEWAEALEEHRAGRPNVWFACEEATESGTFICAPKDEFDCLEYDNIENCKHRSKKPEGVAVELIDGCIRILDWFGRENIRIAGPNTIEKLIRQAGHSYDNMELPDIVAWLNLFVSRAFFEHRRNITNGNKDSARKDACGHLLEALAVAFSYVANTGNDPEELLRMKHEYNKTRSYRHNNKVC